MQLFSKLVEQKLLLCGLDHRSPKIRNQILANTDPADFGTSFGFEIRERIDKLLQLGKELGRAVDFAEDPGLSKEAKTFIRATSSLRRAAKSFDPDRVGKLLNNLKLHRRLRIAYDGLQRATKTLSGRVGEGDIEKFCETLEGTLLGVKEDFDRQPLLHLGRGQSAQDLRRLIKRLTTKQPGRYIDCGLEALNYYYKGFKRGNVVTLSANSGGGKTAVAMNMAVNMVKKGLNVCFVSMEMSEEELLHRIVSREAGIDHDIIRFQDGFTRKQTKQISKAVRRLYKIGKRKDARLTIWDVKDSYFTPQQMELALKPFRFDAIFIDYITLFDSKNVDTWKMQMEYSRYLHGTAKRLDNVIFLLTQLNEDDQIKYGKAIKENTDYWFWWIFGEEEEEDGETEMKTGKARHAKKRNCTLVMKLDTMTVTTKTDDLVGRPDQSSPSRDYGKRSPKTSRRKRRKKEESADF